MDTSDPSAGSEPPGPEDDDPSLSTDESGLVISAPTDDTDGTHASVAMLDTQSPSDAEDSSRSASFDIDDTIRASRTVRVNDGSRLLISFEAFIDWTKGTGVKIRLISHTKRDNPGNKVYTLSTTFRLRLITKKQGKTIPPMEVFPMEDDWPSYGFNPIGASLQHCVYSPANPWSSRNNNIYLPYDGRRLIDGKGEPSDNKLHKVTVWALGGFTGAQQYATVAKSAIRGGA